VLGPPSKIPTDGGPTKLVVRVVVPIVSCEYDRIEGDRIEGDRIEHTVDELVSAVAAMLICAGCGIHRDFIAITESEAR
jgi:hypothetical protein